MKKMGNFAFASETLVEAWRSRAAHSLVCFLDCVGRCAPLQKLAFKVVMVVFSFFAPAVHAIHVTNLSDAPKVIEVERTAGNMQTYEVQPNQTLRGIRGNLRVRVQGQTGWQFGAFHDQFVIWPDGTFAVQFRQKGRGGD